MNWHGGWFSPPRREGREEMAGALAAENAEKSAEISRRAKPSPLKSKTRNLSFTAELCAREEVSAANSATSSRAWRLGGELHFALLLLAISVPGCGSPPQEETEPPQVLTDSVPFVYPLDLWDHNISGQTVLLVRVSATGQVDSVTIDTGSGYPEFDSAAVQGARQLRFIAARQGERRVPMWTKVPVRFARDTTTRMGIGGS